MSNFCNTCNHIFFGRELYHCRVTHFIVGWDDLACEHYEYDEADIWDVEPGNQAFNAKEKFDE
jgi:hypothetical protein